MQSLRSTDCSQEHAVVVAQDNDVGREPVKMVVPWARLARAVEVSVELFGMHWIHVLHSTAQVSDLAMVDVQRSVGSETVCTTTASMDSSQLRLSTSDLGRPLVGRQIPMSEAYRVRIYACP